MNFDPNTNKLFLELNDSLSDQITKAEELANLAKRGPGGRELSLVITKIQGEALAH